MYTFRQEKFINTLNLIMNRLNLKKVKASKLKKNNNDILLNTKIAVLTCIMIDCM